LVAVAVSDVVFVDAFVFFVIVDGDLGVGTLFRLGLELDKFSFLFFVLD
jgi:hypothetical protein